MLGHAMFLPERTPLNKSLAYMGEAVFAFGPAKLQCLETDVKYHKINANSRKRLNVIGAML